MSKKEIDEKKIKKTVDEVKDTAEKVKDKTDKAKEAAEDTVEAADIAVKKAKNFKKLKYGTMFYIVIALVTAIVVVLNVIVNMIAKRSPLKIDITPDNRYELSEESINAVKSLDKDVDITVTAVRDYFEALGNNYESNYAASGIPVEIPLEIIPELLEKYSIYAEQGNGKINVKYVDLNKDPDLIDKYKKYYNGDIGTGSIIVSSGERVRVFTEDEVLGMLSPDQTAMQAQQLKLNFTGESSLTSAITSVTDAHPVKVAFASMMNGASLFDEQSYSDAAYTFEDELLMKNGYDCTEIDISTDEIKPEDYDMVVVFAPSVDFNENIIQKLSDFLYNDGNYDKNMVYVPDGSKTNLPNIEEFLADWSIKVENQLIYDDENSIGSDMFGRRQVQNIIADISSPEDVGTLPSEKLEIVAPASRVLSPISKNNEDIVTEVLKSRNTSYTIDMDNYDPNDPQYGAEEARTIVMLSKKQRADEFERHTSSLLVVGSAGMFNNQLIVQNTSFNNASVLINIMNTMTGKEAGVVIPDKNLQSSFIAPKASQMKKIHVAVVWIIPALVAVVGIAVLLRRRNK